MIPLDPDRPFLISPPFGRWFRSSRAYSVLGSYTMNPRPGRTERLLRTVRPVPGGWVNAVELRNRGLDSLRHRHPLLAEHQVLSIAPLRTLDWEFTALWLAHRYGRLRVELNISCPNLGIVPELPSSRFVGGLIRDSGATVIVKLPPLPDLLPTLVGHFVDAGIRYLHLSNSLPSPVGGVSGRVLREVNLPLVETGASWLEQRGLGGGTVQLIAGGGISRPEHVQQYRNAGASRFSLATAFFWPPRGYRVLAAPVPRPAEPQWRDAC